MSNDLEHGGEWGFTHAVWAPTTKEVGTSWVFYLLVEHVRRDDVVLHLRDGAAFVGYSIATADGYVTTRKRFGERAAVRSGRLDR